MRPQLQTCRNPTWRVEMKMEREAEPKMYDATRHGAGTPFACNRENTCRAWATVDQAPIATTGVELGPAGSIPYSRETSRRWRGESRPGEAPRTT